MKRNALATIDATYTDENELPTPVRLDNEDLEKLSITISGHKFINLGHCIVCPKDGVISGIAAAEAPDKEVGFYLKFGCDHYRKEDKKGA